MFLYLSDLNFSLLFTSFKFMVSNILAQFHLFRQANVFISLMLNTFVKIKCDTKYRQPLKLLVFTNFAKKNFAASTGITFCFFVQFVVNLS
jgi:hypothetical protein